MVNTVEKSYINAYRQLLEMIPPMLSIRVKKRNFTNDVILKIARYVIVNQDINGSVQISKSAKKNVYSTRDQIELIRKICSLRLNRPTNIKENANHNKNVNNNSKELRQLPPLELKKHVNTPSDEETESSDEEVEICENSNRRPFLDDIIAIKDQDHFINAASIEFRNQKFKHVDDIAYATNLKSFNLIWCENLVDIKGIANLKNLENLVISGSYKLSNLNCLKDLTNLTSLTLTGCDIKDLSWIVNLENLRKLNLCDCNNLKNIGDLAALKKITSIKLNKCQNLEDISGIAALTNLTELNLNWCENLRHLNDLENLINLTSLSLYGCSNLIDVRGLSTLINLKKLNIGRCKNLEDISSIANITSLTTLIMELCDSVVSIDDLAPLTNLTELHLGGCKKIKYIRFTDNHVILPNLKLLDLRHCENLIDISGIANLTSLTKLNLNKCKNISSIDCLQFLPNLESIRLDKCDNIPSMDDIEDAFENLELVDIKPLVLDHNLYREQCILCVEEYEDIARRGTLIKATCGDMFDKLALQRWIRNKIDPECPKCEHPLSEKDLIEKVIINPQQILLERPFDYLVTLNCHSDFVDDDTESFELPYNAYIMAPHPKGFDESYNLKSPSDNQSFEELIAKQHANDFIVPSSGGWKLYAPGQNVPNLKLSPWELDHYQDWSKRNPVDAEIIDKTKGVLPFAKVSGKNSLGKVVQYGKKNSQKIVIFSERNVHGTRLTLKDIVLNMAKNSRDPILLIPFICNVRNDSDVSITCESYGGFSLKAILENEINK